jgi:predicted outer membrane protein
MRIRALAFVTALVVPATLAVAEPAPPSPTPAPPTPSPTDKPMDKSADKPVNTTPSDTPADKPGTTMNNKGAKLSEGDVKIVAHLHHVNQMEIDLGKTAQKTGTASVKAYGETLEKDHQSADRDLTAFAKQHKLAAIPADKPQTDADKQEQKEMMSQMARLKALKGADFDKEFLNMMAAGHDKELAKIDVSISAAADPDLQNMLKQVKPVLQRHADQARDLQKNSPQASNDKPAERPAEKLPSSR